MIRDIIYKFMFIIVVLHEFKTYIDLMMKYT